MYAAEKWQKQTLQGTNVKPARRGEACNYRLRCACQGQGGGGDGGGNGGAAKSGITIPMIIDLVAEIFSLVATVLSIICTL